MNQNYTSVKEGRKVVASAGTRVQLVSSDTRCRKVDIMAEADNADRVIVGGAGVVAALATRKGIPLVAGQSITIYINNLQAVWLDSVVSGEGVTFNYYD